MYERARALDQVFRDVSGFGIQVVGVDDARPYLNSLLVWQLLWLPTAMCNTTLATFLSFAEGRELAAGILAEGFEAMERAGLLQPIVVRKAGDHGYELIAGERRLRAAERLGLERSNLHRKIKAYGIEMPRD